MAVTVISYPSNQISESFATNATLNSNEVISYVWVDVSEATTDEYIEIVYNGVITTLYIKDECRYNPLDIFFINKEGAEQSLTFFKSQTQNINISSEQFESDRGQPIFGNHQYTKYNIQGKEKIKVNSGFVDEDVNEAFTQLLLSEKVWLFQDSIFTPLNVATTNFKYKTRQNDRLINYEIDFDYAFNKINNV
jgi:hypothetical protein